MYTTTSAAGGDTWGISGPSFLGSYLLLAALLLAAAVIARRAARKAPGSRSVAGWDADPYRVAYLHEGPDLALTAALGALRAEGVLSAEGRSVAVIGQPDLAGRPALERAVLELSRVSVPRRTLAGRRAVRDALDAIRADLIARGLLLDERQRASARRWGRWMLALGGLGLVRVLAGLAGDKPVAWLVLLVAVSILAGWLHWAVPTRTVRGDDELAQVRRRHESLDPRLRTDWAAAGAGAVAMGVAVFGASALWAADPAFASEVGAQEASRLIGGGSSSGGGAYVGGDSGGGDSGGGGCGGGCGG